MAAQFSNGFASNTRRACSRFHFSVFTFPTTRSRVLATRHPNFDEEYVELCDGDDGYSHPYGILKFEEESVRYGGWVVLPNVCYAFRV